jgi:serine/threonine protein kinase
MKNILMMGDVAVLSDFNRSRDQSAAAHSRFYPGHFGLVPPEIPRSALTSSSSSGGSGSVGVLHGPEYDMWGYAILVASMIRGVTSSSSRGGGASQEEDWEMPKDDPSWVQSHVDAACAVCDREGELEIKDIMLRCFDSDPTNRLSAKDVVERLRLLGSGSTHGRGRGGGGTAAAGGGGKGGFNPNPQA